MVAIFTGLGAGFERGSGAALGGGGLLGSASLGRGGEGVFLNAATGNLVLQRQDEFLVGRGPDVAIARTYNSLGALDDNGDQWRQSTDRRIVGSGTFNVVGHTVVRVSADGSEITYTYGDWDPTSGTDYYYRATDGAGAHDKLVYNAGDWTWTDGSSRITELYKASDGGFISEQRDTELNGTTYVNTIKFTYANGKLVRIATANDATGAQSAVEYVWSGAHISAVVTKYTDYTGATPVERALTRTIYEYLQDGTDRLSKVTVDETPANTADNATDPETLYTITYAYDGASKRVASISQTDGSELKIKYDASDRVEWLIQTVAAGDTRVTWIEYLAGETKVHVYQQEFDPLTTPAASRPAAITTSFHYETLDANNFNQLKKVVAPPAFTGASAQQVEYVYDSAGNVARVTQKAGAVTASEVNYVYDAFGNITQVTDANGNITDRTYTANNAIALEMRTGFTASGELSTLYTRFVYDAENHLVYTIRSEAMSGVHSGGRVTEYRYKTTGELEFTVDYPQHLYATTSPPTIPAASAMDAWRNGLTDRSTTKIHQYVYDARGGLTRSWGYGAANAAGAAIVTEGSSDNFYTYNQAGELLSRYNAANGAASAESFVYDGLGRVKASTDLAGGNTTILFDDAATKTTVTTTATGFTSVSTHNKAGELLKRVDFGLDTYTANSTTADAATVEYKYDKNGQARMTVLKGHRDGALRDEKSYHLYDKAGRKIADIGHGGQMIEYKYDHVTGRLIATTRYQNVLTAAQLTKLANPDSELELIGSGTETANQILRPAAHSYDIWQWSVYDLGGRVIQTIEGDGSITAYAYDKSNRLVKTTGYFNKLAVSAFMTTPPTSAVTTLMADARDVITRSFYDGDGRLIGALNGDGFLSEIVYDSAGQKIQEIGYANATVLANRSTGTFATLRSGLANAAKDATTRFVYDGQGLLRFTIDALNRVSELIYWEGAGNEHYATGLVRKTIVHITPLGSVTNYTYAAVKAAVTSNAADRVAYNVYNDRAQLVYTVDALGAVTGFVYDALGRVTKTTQFATTTSVSGTAAQWKANLDTWAAANSAGARITRNYYAARAGDLLFSIDAEGYVTGFVYEAQGRLYSQVRYANKLTPTDAWTTATVTSAGKGGTVWTLYRYDTLGRLQEVHDGNGVRRSKFYYGNGKQSWEIAAYAMAGSMDEARTLYVYDQAGKLTREIRYTSEVSNANLLGTAATLIAQQQRITSANGQYSALLTREGELRVYHKGEQIWSNGVREVVAGATYRLVAQTDGNLKIFRDVSGQASVERWSSNTAGSYSGVAFLVMQDDGNLVFAKGTAPTSLGTIWSTNTTGVVASAGAAEWYDTRYTYDGLGNRLTTVNANSDTTTYTYDKAGRVLTRTNSPDGGLNHVTTYEYDAFGRGVKVTDPSNNVSYNFFDKLGRVIQSVDEEYYVTATSYSAFGEVATVTRYLNKAANQASVNVSTPPTTAAGDTGAVTSFTYDKLSRVLTRTDAQNASTTFQYDTLGQLVKTIDALEGQSFIYYDALGRVRYTVDAENYVTETIYDASNAITRKRYATKLAATPTSTSTPPSPSANGALDQSTAYTYDGVGRVLTQTDGLNGVTQFQYDRRGNLVKATDASGNASYFYYDKLNRVTLAIDAEGYATATKYKPTGEAASVTRYAAKATSIGDVGKAPTLTPDAAKDNTTAFVYDKLGRATSETNGEGVVITYAYDANGNVTSKNEAGLRTTTYQYDNLNRLVKIFHDPLYVVATATSAYPASASNQIEELAYDALSNVIEKKDAAGAKTLFWYDKLGRLTHEVSALGTLSVHSYDANGNRTQTQIYATLLSPPPTAATGAAPTQTGSVRTTQYEYDKLNRATKTKVLGATIGRYDTSLATPAFTVTIATLETLTEYDAIGNVVLVTDAKGAKTYSYYDKLGRKTVQIDAANYRTDWSYDAIGNVLSERRYATAHASPPASVTAVAPSPPATTTDDRVTDFSYDKMGRRLTETRANVLVHNGLGAQISQSTAIAYEYNALGAVTKKTEASGDFISYVYDKAGRLTEEQRSPYIDFESISRTPTVKYSYNGLNDLLEARQLGTVAAEDRVTTYTYGVGGRLLTKSEQIDASQSFKHSYFYDAAGRISREEYNRLDLTPSAVANEAIGYDYDLAGRVVRQGVMVKSGSDWSRNGAAIDTVAMDYNAFGEIAQRGFAHYDTQNAETTLFAEKFEYDSAGRLTRTNSGDGTWKYFMYDAAGNQTLMIASSGNQTSTGAIAAMDLNNAVGVDTMSEVLALWASAAAIGTTNVAGVTATITSYDARNQAIEVREPQRQLTAAGALTDLKTSRVYNAFGEVIQEASANAHDAAGAIIAAASLQYAYNTMGRLILTTSPAVSVTGENGVVTANVRPTENRYYDAAGRLVASRDGNANLTKLTLLAGTGYGGTQALVAAVFDPATNYVTTTGYDIHGQARKITDQLGRVTTQSFDRMGRLTQVTHPVTQPGALVDYYEYDGLGQRTKHWNSLLGASKSERLTYDQQGRLVEVIAMGGDPVAGQNASTGGDITRYAYAWDGALVGGWTQTTTYANFKILTESTDVFGRAIGKTDLNGNVTGFTYDMAGRLTQRSGGDALNLSYFNTGRLASETTTHNTTIIKPAPGPDNTRTNTSTKTASFGYDKVGNLTLETLARADATWTYSIASYAPTTYQWDPVSNVSYSYKNATATFDALGRITSWAEAGSTQTPAASHVFEYDSNGNIRRSLGTFRSLNAQGVASSSATTQDNWYRYDAMNRMVTAQGQLVAGAIVRGAKGVDTFYDLAGNRKYTLTSFDDVWYPADTAVWFTNTRREDYFYDAENRVIEVDEAVGWSPGSAPTAAGPKRGAFSYDLMGRLVAQTDYNTDGLQVLYSRAVTYNSKGQVSFDTSSTVRAGGVTYKADSTYSYGTIGSSVLDTTYALGAAIQIDTDNFEKAAGATTFVQKKTNKTVNTYQWRDGAVQWLVQYTPDLVGAPNTINTSTYAYDIIGGQAQLASVSIVDGRSRTVSFVNDLLGQGIKRDEADALSGGDPHEIWYRFGGRQQGYVGNNGTIDTNYATSVDNRLAPSGTGAFANGATTSTSFADFDLATDYVNSYAQGSNTGMYIVQSGDTLAGIAANLWGDANLWYKLAEVNGLTAESALPEGLPLIIPAGVMRNQNNASTFQPYDPLEVLGNTAPTTPVTPKPKKAKCGVFGQILLVVIAVVVTIWSAGAAAGAFGAMAQGTSVLTGMMTGGAAAFTGGLAAAVGAGMALTPVGFFAAGAIGGAVGSIVSQGIGVATGIQDKFSWNAVGLAAIGGGLGAGGAQPQNWVQAMAKGVVNSVRTQAIGVATGLQKEFSWAGVAAAGVGAGVFSKVGSMLPANMGDTARLGIASGAQLIADAASRSLIEGTDFGDNVMAALPNVIGSVVGSAIAGRIAGNGTTAMAMKSMKTAQGASTPAALEELSGLDFQMLDKGAASAAGLPPGTAIAMGEDGTTIYSLPSQSGRVRGGDFTAWSFDGEGRVIISANTDFHIAAAISETESLMFFTNGAGQSSETIAAWARPGETRVVAVPEIGGSITFVGPARQDAVTQIAAGAVRTFVGGGNDLAMAGLFAVQHPVDAGRAVIDAGVGAWRSTVNTAGMAMTDSGRAQLGNQIGGWANRTGSNIAWHANNGTLWDGVGQVAGGLALAEVTGGGLLSGPGGAVRAACFVAGTLIHTREGLKPIEQVQLGDFVLSRPQQDGEAGERRVVNLVRFDDKPILEIVVATAGGRTETLRTTGEHPFWVDGDGWVAASELKADDRLRLADGGDACIASVTDTGTTAPVFNFEVEGWHTYHIGELGVWVHNADCFGDILISNGIARPAGMANAHAHHIVYKMGVGEVQQQIAADGRAILIRNGIDPIRGVENLVWAPNVKGQHTVANITSVVNELRAAEQAGYGRAGIEAVLKRQGQLAAGR